MTGTLLATILAASLATAPIQPRSVTGITVALVTVSQPTLRQYGREFRGLHLVAAVSGYGELAGALLKANGRERCQFRGYIDDFGDVTVFANQCR